MGVLIGGFLILFGFIFFCVGGIPLIIAAVSGRPPWAGQNIAFFIFGFVGLIILLVGLVILLRSRASIKTQKALAMKIYELGVAAEGTVTFVDKNYSLLVNQKPIYTIVEFKFEDRYGKEHISRKANVESDLVIRLKLEVGSKVQLKYMNDNPDQNILMLPDPQKAAQA